MLQLLPALCCKGKLASGSIQSACKRAFALLLPVKTDLAISVHCQGLPHHSCAFDADYETRLYSSDPDLRLKEINRQQVAACSGHAQKHVGLYSPHEPAALGRPLSMLAYLRQSRHRHPSNSGTLRTGRRASWRCSIWQCNSSPLQWYQFRHGVWLGQLAMQTGCPVLGRCFSARPISRILHARYELALSVRL